MDIISQIVAGVRKTSGEASTLSELKSGRKKGYIVEPDRKSAIEMAIGLSSEGDSVLIAGKGHETYQIIGKEKRFFDDRVIAKNALEQIGGC